MRGKDGDKLPAVRLSGITPAHAGKSALCAVTACHQRDHPRPCGEKLMRGWFYNGDAGSPPPMRGKVNADNVKQFVDRITPAHAGKSTLDGVSGTDAADHPRPCGEKTINLRITPRTKGSPPPMRGKGLAPCASNGRLGITPAHAGKRVHIR